MSYASLLGAVERAEAALRDVRLEIAALEASGSKVGLPTSPTARAPQTPTPAPGRTLSDPAGFFDSLRTSKALGPTLTTEEVSGCEAICAACAGLPVSWAAYALATAVVETAGTMQPIKERGGNAYFTRLYDVQGERPDLARKMGNTEPGDGARYCGRGYVQLTWKTNYAKAGLKLGQPLVDNPDLALRPDIAAAIMRQGMQAGWFTGKSLETYLPAVADIHQFTNARRIINGQDRAVEIAGYALEMQRALKQGGWTP